MITMLISKGTLENLWIHRSSMVALLETKMANHISIIEEYESMEMIEVPTKGKSRGLVILWNHATATINFTRRNQKIYAMIKIKPNHKNWLFSFIYASIEKTNRDILWRNIEAIYNSYKDP